MIRFFLLLFFLMMIFSCQKEYKSRTIDSVDIHEFKVENTSIRAIVAIDEQQVHFAGSNGKIGFTKNEGKNWEINQLKYQDSIIPNFRSLASNGTDFFALSIGNPALLYKISNNKTTIVYKEEDENVFYDSMQFFDNKNGIAIGDPTDNCMSVILTNDGGNSWKKVSCDNLPKSAEGEAAFAASNTNISIVDDVVWFASGGMKSRIYKSEDFGKTWQVFATPILQNEPTKGIYSIDFYNKNFGIAIGGDYSKPDINIANKAITKDGGKTWELIADGENPNYKSSIQFVPNTKGQEIFAVGKTGVSFSNDAGQIWKKVSDESYYAIDFVDENTAWLSGNKKIGKMSLK